MTELICIVCPKGCHLKIDNEQNVTGYGCKRGIRYAITETTNPTRMITSTVKIENGEVNRLPVMTSSPVPKGQIFSVMESINKVVVQAPVKVKDIVLSNVCNLNIDVIATRNVNKLTN